MAHPGEGRLTRRWKIAIVTGSILVGLLFAAGIYFAVRMVLKGEFVRDMDVKFGDQHLRTAVALIELHKVRHSRYPDRLSDLEFMGDWDQIILSSVDYCPNQERTGYFVEVRRGWVGKPALQIPEEFWRGTGYRRDLGPCPESPR